MALTAKQVDLARTIDAHVSHVQADDRGDEALLIAMADHMVTFKELLDTSTEAEVNQLCQQYRGFYRYAEL